MKKYLKTIFLLSFVTFCIVLSGCTKTKLTSNTQSKDNKLSVAVSIVPEETFVKAVAGDLVNVVTLIPPGESPENFQPTPDLLKDFSNSKLYFSIGVPTEKASILPKAKDLNPDIEIISLDKKVSAVYPDREFSKNNRDPHIWLSLKRAKVMVNVIKDELCKVDPKNKVTYEKNSKAYIEKLDKVDSEIKDSLKDLKNKTVIVYHPCLGYFCDDYNLKMIALEKEGKESTIQDLQETINLAKKANIKVIFYQAEIDSSQAKTFAQEINGKCELVAPLSSSYIDNLKKMCNTFKETLN